MKQRCRKCGQELKDGDKIRVVALSIYHEISSVVTYAIEKPYECESIEHLNCNSPN